MVEKMAFESLKVLEIVRAANNAVYMPKAVACGCGRAYVTLSSKNDRKTVNAVAKACKTLGLMFLRKAYGTTGNSIYIGYDNADGRALGRAEAFAAKLTEHGIPAYSDAVAD